jgi:general secretion pathway protein D
MQLMDIHKRMNLFPSYLLFSSLVVVLCSCAGSSAFKRGKKFERIKNYDEALQNFEQALQKEPRNIEYRLYHERARFEAAIAHFDQGRKLREAGNLEESLAEFQRASAIDPSNSLAAQEVRSVQKMIQDRQKLQEEDKKKLGDIIEKNKVTGSREILNPTLNTPIVLKLTKDLKTAYETIAKLGGINVIFDSDLGPKLQTQTPLDLNNVTIIEALDLLALQTKTYWTAVNKNTILVATDNQQTRQLYEEQVIKTFYLGNSLAATDLAETITMLRLLLTLSKVAPITAQNAIVVRDTPDKIAMAEKILQSIDKAKPEVLIDIAVLEVDRSVDRTLGLQPPSSTSATFSSGTTTTTTGTGGTTSTTTTPNNTVPIKNLGKIGSGNFSITIPSSSLDAVYKRSHARVLQNPSIRAADGKQARLRIGQKRPVAQGSFQPTFAGNTGGTPVVNFTTIDIGVNLDMTPRVLLNRDIAMTIQIQVSATAGTVSFSGLEYPILTNREIQHDIRLKEGESSVIGGIITDSDNITVSGVAGLSKIPLLRYLFSTESKNRTEAEIIIVITPHIVRLPEYLEDDYASIALLGAGNSPKYIGRPIHLLGDNVPAGKAAQAGPGQPATAPGPGGPSATPAQAKVPPATVPRLAAVKLTPSSAEVAVGSRVGVSAMIENAQNVYALSFNLAFDPKVLKLVEVQNGGFLSSDGKIIALAPRIENETGQAVVSITRPPESSGMSGNGVLLNLVFETLAAGTSAISFTQANIRDLSQTTLPASFSSTQVRVK